MAFMRFTSKVFLVKLDKRAWRAALKKEMIENTKEAARSWLQTVTVIIPTWSKASLSTFQKLADSVGFNITFGPLRSFKDRSSLGRNVSRGGLEIKAQSWHFFYETDLRYLRHNEFNTAVKGDGSGVYSQLRNPGPYRFQEAGKSDFISFSEQIKFPNPIKFISGQSI